MPLVYTDLPEATGSDWFWQYAVLSKMIYCWNPQKWAQDTSGDIRYTIRGVEQTHTGEPHWVRTTPTPLLAPTPNGFMAQLDHGLDPQSLLAKKPMAEWMRMHINNVFRPDWKPPVENRIG
ncbi:MAG: hypothetical protein A2Y38_11900 [Spirochaetes bacterium GWB1_59_5]|nr:MAG: hypothetical protein A2Y38_11900 [Spirochaetes bacterium GWB1_59_5]